MKGMIFNMKFLKKNQIIIYTFALMLVAAGYLNYTTNINNETIETSSINENYEENNEIADDKKVINDEKKEVNEVEKEETKEEIKENNNENEKKIDNNTKNGKENNAKLEVADIGDATLVSSRDITTDYFVKSKLDRDTMYSQMIESYEKIINSSNSLETQKQSATQEITKINDIKNSIMICENLLKTKGFENCIIFINGKNANVVIGKKLLKQDEIAQIQNIVSRELNIKIENLHITTKE